MPPLVLGLVLGSAVLHASWNALLRSGTDRLWSVSVMCAMCALAGLPVALLAPRPDPASWPYLAVSGVLQVAYSLFLARAYRDGRLAQVYPIARGSAPMLVTLAAAVLAGEQPAGPGLAGIVLVSLGILAIALGRGRLDGRSTLAALATGAFIAAYMTCDGLGVRVSGHPMGYIGWQAVVQGAPMPFVFAAIRRRWLPLALDRELGKMAVAAVISVAGYGVVVWAMSQAPLGQVSALRETSILFAAVIGALFLREPLTLRGVVGAATIAAGAICLSLS